MSSSSHFNPDGLRLVSYCPLCETEFNPMEARILGEKGETSLVHVKCQACKNAMLALILVSKAGVSSVGLVTDLSFEDVVKFRKKNRISIDDVLAFHESLEKSSELFFSSLNV